MYAGKIQRREVQIGNKVITVGSQLEERVLRYLEANGFSDLWEKPKAMTKEA